ncbi:PREDICTED: uncharacterized protein LOC109232745 [Nicotiana attenuata]|uniref:Transmembrane protein n=1 Tax=Nicotiana attenuata TaxID=49451 RepID=A0A1J6ILA4_NICAT|nr:PREDICTED: uncharacterized protein LOC109232745 [Nicotiana attenuata]OIS98502.1 hypothetical protein A4A49_25897 [Nicotiana attenuata]
MERFRKVSILLIFWFVTFSFATIHTYGDATQKNVQQQETYSTLVTSSLRYWDNVKSYINQLQLKFFPPDLDFRSKEVAYADGGATERVKEAAQKSFGKSKETVEETAKSAAKVVEQTVHKTVEKVRGSASSGHDRDEL